MRICAWGDSITYGACDSEGLGWVGRMRKSLFADGDESTTFYNRGVGGDTSANLLARMPVEFESLRPEIAIVAIGINDSVYKGTDKSKTLTSLSDFEQNLTQIFAVAGSAKKVYSLGLTRVTEELVQPLPWSTTGKSYSNSVIAQFDEVLKKVSRDAGVTYIDMSASLEPSDLMDGLHPNAQGYDKMADKILAEIKGAL